MVVRSSREIARNEETTISYINSTQSFEERWRVSSATYMFACQCPKCMKGFEEREEILTGNSVSDSPILIAKSELHAFQMC